MPAEDIKKELRVAGIPSDAVERILHALSLRSLSELEESLDLESGAVAELKQLFSFATKYGYADWLQFDALVVRGLAYYTRNCLFFRVCTMYRKPSMCNKYCLSPNMQWSPG